MPWKGNAAFVTSRNFTCPGLHDSMTAEPQFRIQTGLHSLPPSSVTLANFTGALCASVSSSMKWGDDGIVSLCCSED